jgi:hypothetical protein
MLTESFTALDEKYFRVNKIVFPQIFNLLIHEMKLYKTMLFLNLFNDAISAVQDIWRRTGR